MAEIKISSKVVASSTIGLKEDSLQKQLDTLGTSLDTENQLARAQLVADNAAILETTELLQNLILIPWLSVRVMNEASDKTLQEITERYTQIGNISKATCEELNKRIPKTS